MNKRTDHVARGAAAARKRSGLLLWWTVALVAFVAGCGEPMPPSADPQRAEAALKTALDAWRRGDEPQALQAQTPPIHVSDTEWSNGAELKEYEIKSGQAAGLGWRCEVVLKVKDASGRTREHQASYRIDTDPAIVVVHEE